MTKDSIFLLGSCQLCALMLGYLHKTENFQPVVLNISTDQWRAAERAANTSGGSKGRPKTEKLNEHSPEYRGIRLDSGGYSDVKAKSCSLISTPGNETTRWRSDEEHWICEEGEELTCCSEQLRKMERSAEG